MQITPLIPFLMAEDEVRRLYERALRILDQIGLRVRDERLIRRLQGKRGVRFAQGRVTFDPAVAAEMVGLAQRQKAPVPARPVIPERMSIVTSYHARSIVDAETGAHRPLTEADAIAMARLTDALRDRDVLGAAPGAPQDLPARLRSVAQYRISLEWSRTGHYAPVSAVAEYRYVREMARAVGEDFGMECYLISPLRLEGNEVACVLDYLESCAPGDKPVPVCATSMPTMGLSGPADPLAIFVLGLAESVGGFLALRLAFGDDIKAALCRPNAYPCNFQTGGLIVGSPEAVLIEIIRRDLDRFFRLDSFARALRTMSCLPGIQTAAEKAAGALAAALAGYEHWFGGGMIGLDEIFSPIQLLIDCEIRDYALQVARGFEADDKFDDVAVLRDVLLNADGPLPFMTHPTTLDTFRNVFRPPTLFRRQPYKGEPHPREDLIERAREDIKRRIASHTYRLEADKLAEIDGIYRRAQADLA